MSKHITIPDFSSKAELFGWLKANKDLLMAQKKAEIKQADAVHLFAVPAEQDAANKAAAIPEDATELMVKSIINTTNLFDSHRDVHIPGLWDKSLKEQKLLYLVQEHKMAFDHIISDEVKASAVTYTWAQLGYNMPGTTQALVFDSVVKMDRNPLMFKQYKKGWVKNHSVGMRYMKLYLAVNSEEPAYTVEKDAWDKYYPMIANKEEVDAVGYFWAVTEAKIVEGSAVPMGSNWATPTQSVSSKAAEEGTLDSTEPPAGTQEDNQTKTVDWEKIANKSFSFN